MLQSIQVNNPCAAQGSNNQMMGQNRPIREFNRDQELSQIGSFNLEESVANIIGLMDEDSTKFVDIAEFQANLDQIIQATNIPRNQTGA